MADIVLDPINRSRLDGIVQKALANGENDDTVKQIVSEYKTKYGAPAGSSMKTHNQGMGQPTSAESSQYVERQPSFREAIGKDIPSAIALGGSFAGPIGGAAGSAFGEGLRNLAPEQFGGGSVEEDLAFNAALPGLMGSINKFAAGPRQYIADKLASRFGQYLPPVKKLMEGVRGYQAETQAAGDTAVQASSEAYQNAAKEAELNYRKKIFGAKDPKVLDPNVPTPGDFRLPNPADFNTRAGDLPKGYTGFTAPEPNLSAVRGILQKAQEKVKDEIKNPILRYARNSIIFRLGVMGGLGGISPAAAGIGTTLVLGEEGIKKLVGNPETAQLIIKAINTPSADEQAGLISNTLLHALRGTAITIKNANGDEQPAMVDNDGKLVYKR